MGCLLCEDTCSLYDLSSTLKGYFTV